jgi:hydrogenase-4 membrane subunit HyfE
MAGTVETNRRELHPTTHLIVEVVVFLTAAIAFVVTVVAIGFVHAMAQKGESGVPWLTSVLLGLFLAVATLLVLRYLIGFTLTRTTVIVVLVVCLLVVPAAMVAANHYGERAALSVTNPVTTVAASPGINGALMTPGQAT